jgi:maspardin
VQSTLSRQLPRLHEIRSRYADRVVRAGNLEWRLRDTGGGSSVLIMLPGSLGNADIFYLQLLQLASRVRCIAIDYPEAPTAALADGLAALIDVLNIDRANLLGCSLAGYWLQTFGSRHPGRIKSLTLANAFRESGDLRHHPLFSIPKLEAVDGHSLKTEWLARLEAREPDHLRDVQIELLRYGPTGEESLRGRLRAAATAPLAPWMPLDEFPIAIVECEDDRKSWTP